MSLLCDYSKRLHWSIQNSSCTLNEPMLLSRDWLNGFRFLLPHGRTSETVMGNSFVLFDISMEIFPMWFHLVKIGHTKSCFPSSKSLLPNGKITSLTAPNFGCPDHNFLPSSTQICHLYFFNILLLSLSWCNAFIVSLISINFELNAGFT